MAMIAVNNISKSFGRIQAVNDISFQIEKGEVVGLLGPNGAGKTTTLRILTTFLTPDSGTVTINGEDISKNPVRAKQIIGYLPEDTPLYASMKVEEFLLYCAMLKGFKGKKAKQSIESPLEQCRLGDVCKRVIGKLSKGYRQRVGLAQALISNPPILILDEPTVGLDPSQVVQVRHLIKELSQDRTIILSTHILTEVEAVCGKVIIIHTGQILKEASMNELTSPIDGKIRITVEIAGQAEPYIAACKDIDGILSIEKISEHKIEIFSRLDREVQVRENIFRTAVASGAVLTEITKDKITLEATFLELTKSL